MKFLVCVSKVPDTTAPIAVEADGRTLQSNGVTFIMNPYDEWYALVRALELAEQSGGTVTIAHVGDAGSDQLIRKGLAIGAHEAVRVEANPTDAAYIAAQLARVAGEQPYDLIFCGKESIDYNGAEVPAMLAELLDLPFVANVSQLALDGRQARIVRDIEGGVEVLAVQLPVVISAAKGLAAQRIPNMMGIMKAKSKPMTVLEPVAVSEQVHTVRLSMPEGKKGVRMVPADRMDELVRLLREEAKVI
ncbi:MAG: hypothetical protein RLY31_1100 [Bacteroidota bacterium]|jgi:electron transfer flavoprotein beta subunit